MIDVVIRQQLRGLALNVAFQMPSGVTSIFGPSGAGKTSVLRAVAGLSKPETLRLAVEGNDLAARPAHKRRIGYVFQDAKLFPHMSVRDNLRYGGQHDEARIIDLLGLGPLLDRRPRHLSGGEAQRTAIGRALMSNPRLLLLDEPMASLDAARKSAILPYLETLRDEAQIPILHVSHDIAEVTRLASHLVILSNGQVVTSGPLAELLGTPRQADLLGPRQFGSLILARIAQYLPDDDVTQLTCAGGTVLVPGQAGAVGQSVRLRIMAHDVILAATRPVGVSALNVLPVTIQSIDPGTSGVSLAMGWGPDRLVARITQRSANALNLTPGQALFAIVKASALGPG